MFIQASYKLPGFKISWDPESVEVFTDSTGKEIVQKNKAVSIWRKQKDGSWKNVVDISTPAAHYDFK